MTQEPLVSIVIIFLNADRFLGEAIESVGAQTYHNWELLLVDDGSTDSSADIAGQYLKRWPGKVRYLEHPGHANHGMSASRNLGAMNADGQYIAFMDADDAWLPNKLEEQVKLLEAHQSVGMIYGKELYWHSWDGNSEQNRRDHIPKTGVSSNTIFPPPELLPLFLSGRTAVPCPSSILLKRGVMDATGGFAEAFIGPYGVYEDQAFFSKVCLHTPVLVCHALWVRYRQHPEAVTAVSRRLGQERAARRFFLDWLRGYLREQGETDEALWLTLQRELWLLEAPDWLPEGMLPRLRWVKKWLLRGGVAQRRLRLPP